MQGQKNVSKHVQSKDATCARRSLLRQKSVTRRPRTSTSLTYMLGHKRPQVPPASQAGEWYENRDRSMPSAHAVVTVSSSHSSFSAPFHHAPRVQPTLGACNGSRGDQATENARKPRRSRSNASIARGTAVVRVWGSPVDYGESPQKIGRWGAKRVELDATHDIGL